MGGACWVTARPRGRSRFPGAARLHPEPGTHHSLPDYSAFMSERATPAYVGTIEPHDAYAALRHREFRWFIVSLFTMVVSSQLQAVVVGWQVYRLTHDPLSLGLIGLAEALPFIAVALPAGYLADRQDRRAISVASLFVLACCSAALLAFSLSNGLLTRVGVGPIYATIFV